MVSVCANMECEICKSWVPARDFYAHAKQCCLKIGIHWNMPEGFAKQPQPESLQNKVSLLQHENVQLKQSLQHHAAACEQLRLA